VYLRGKGYYKVNCGVFTDSAKKERVFEWGYVYKEIK
jgi:hypothetical protein